jgi:hypothetical protein
MRKPKTESCGVLGEYTAADPCYHIWYSSHPTIYAYLNEGQFGLSSLTIVHFNKDEIALWVTKM